MCIWRTIVRHFSNQTNLVIIVTADIAELIMKILLDTCACIFYVSDNVMTRVHLANNILVHIIMYSCCYLKATLYIVS